MAIFLTFFMLIYVNQSIMVDIESWSMNDLLKRGNHDTYYGLNYVYYGGRFVTPFISTINYDALYITIETFQSGTGFKIENNDLCELYYENGADLNDLILIKSYNPTQLYETFGNNVLKPGKQTIQISDSILNKSEIRFLWTAKTFVDDDDERRSDDRCYLVGDVTVTGNYVTGAPSKTPTLNTETPTEIPTKEPTISPSITPTKLTDPPTNAIPPTSNTNTPTINTVTPTIYTQTPSLNTQTPTLPVDVQIMIPTETPTVSPTETPPGTVPEIPTGTDAIQISETDTGNGYIFIVNKNILYAIIGGIGIIFIISVCIIIFVVIRKRQKKMETDIENTSQQSNYKIKNDSEIANPPSKRRGTDTCEMVGETGIAIPNTMAEGVRSISDNNHNHNIEMVLPPPPPSVPLNTNDVGNYGNLFGTTKGAPVPINLDNFNTYPKALPMKFNVPSNSHVETTKGGPNLDELNLDETDDESNIDGNNNDNNNGNDFVLTHGGPNLDELNLDETDDDDEME
mmetsp:Transcript_22858/g.28098  ORF Transcript_22858/g.28098 Transcript_22858/m.28098 type:complete len:514 (-) Transcript_22858:39-1580(-)